MNANDFVSPDKIIAEVTQTVNDKEFKNGFKKGWFESRIHDALQKLAFETFYQRIKIDVEMPDNLRLPMPANVFNIREIYAFNGEICNPSTSQVLHHKRLFDNGHEGDGYTARVKDDGSNSGDVFLPNQRQFTNNNNGFFGLKYYWNVDDKNIIMMSKECAGFDFLRIMFNGMGGVYGEKPVIPRFFQRAIVDYVEERYYNAMKMRKPRVYRALWMDADTRLKHWSGDWNQSRKFVISMDTAAKESMEEYISSMYHK